MRRRGIDNLEDDSGNYLVSVSDIMSGLLFLFIITLVVFVIQFDNAQATLSRTQSQLERAKNRKEAQIEKLTDNFNVRKRLLETIEEELEREGITVEIDPKTGVLILGEEAVSFRSGAKHPTPRGERHLEMIAAVLESIIPCYSSTQPQALDCNPSQEGEIDSILIEGHTDSEPTERRNYTNWNLSSDRAIESYQVMTRVWPGLAKIENTKGQPIFGVAGYADQRPRPGCESKGCQRRIELRFIMTPPKTSSGLQPIEDVRAAGIH